MKDESKLKQKRVLKKNEFAKLHALRAFSPYMPWFLSALITRLARLICYLRALLTRDIKSLIKDKINAIVRLPHPRNRDSQGQKTFLAPSADK